MAGTTTAYCTSYKVEQFFAAHCNGATVTPTASGTSGQFTLTSLSALTGIVVGMAASGTNVAAGAVVVSIDSSTQVTLSKAHTGTVGPTATITFTGDVFKMALIKVSPTGTYDATSTNYSNITGNSDETSGTGYTATGAALTNTSPTSSSTTAFITYSNPSWTSATFSTTACMIYNTSTRYLTSTAGRAQGVFDFGGTQSVSAGTFTVLMPTANSSTAIFRLA